MLAATQNTTLARVEEAIRSVFADDTITVARDTTAADVPGWDSLMHVTLLVCLERTFQVRFSSAQVASLANVGEIVSLIDTLRTH